MSDELECFFNGARAGIQVIHLKDGGCSLEIRQDDQDDPDCIIMLPMVSHNVGQLLSQARRTVPLIITQEPEVAPSKTQEE